jgi:hypothetical protein
VADAMRRIADLKAHIEKLEHDGHDAADGKKLLAVFESSLKLMIDYRDRLARTLRG